MAKQATRPASSLEIWLSDLFAGIAIAIMLFGVMVVQHRYHRDHARWGKSITVTVTSLGDKVEGKHITVRWSNVVYRKGNKDVAQATVTLPLSYGMGSQLKAWYDKDAKQLFVHGNTVLYADGSSEVLSSPWSYYWAWILLFFLVALCLAFWSYGWKEPKIVSATTATNPATGDLVASI